MPALAAKLGSINLAQKRLLTNKDKFIYGYHPQAVHYTSLPEVAA